MLNLQTMKTLIIGLGNPILGDDGVGWKVANQLTTIIDPDFSVEIDCASLGGLSLMERMLGYQRVIVIDLMETGQSPEGLCQSISTCGFGKSICRTFGICA